MPQAYITLSRSIKNPIFIRRLVSTVKKSAAENLNVEGGELTPADINVEVQFAGEFDSMSRDIQIIIFAHEYPARKANVEERSEKITKDIGLLSVVDLFVWIILAPTGFTAVGKHP